MSASQAPPARSIAIIGLGYVGLPVALAMGRRFPGCLGFDLDEAKVSAYRDGRDPTGELGAERFADAQVRFSSDPSDLEGCDFFIVAVPTPIDSAKRPDLRALRSASESVGRALKPGAIVVYESTVYPGLTREVCGPILEASSGLVCGREFKLGYSPERINPGDPKHTFETITKVVAGQDEESLDIIASVYESVVPAGVHRASSLEVAEASKVIENIQRDLNIALMNELAQIFDRMGIPTREVLAASRSKWNFLPFHPGLVGGHCIGVDPYYLTTRAAEFGITPEVILAGRRTNDETGRFIAQRTIKELALAKRPIHGARIAILGLCFKENVPDLRNSRVPDIIDELRSYGASVLVQDPLADPEDALREYGLELCSKEDLRALDAVVLAVPHEGQAELARELVESGVPVLMDVRGSVVDLETRPGLRYWGL